MEVSKQDSRLSVERTGQGDRTAEGSTSSASRAEPGPGSHSRDVPVDRLEPRRTALLPGPGFALQLTTFAMFQSDDPGLR